MFSWSSKGHKASGYPGARSSGGGSGSGVSRDEHIQSYLNDPTLKPSTRRVSAGENALDALHDLETTTVFAGRPSHTAFCCRLTDFYSSLSKTHNRRQHVRHGVPDQERPCPDIASPSPPRPGIETAGHDPGGRKCSAFLVGLAHAHYWIPAHLLGSRMGVLQPPSRVCRQCCRAAFAAQPPQ